LFFFHFFVFPGDTTGTLYLQVTKILLADIDWHIDILAHIIMARFHSDKHIKISGFLCSELLIEYIAEEL
jgi:hypothetical protein